MKNKLTLISGKKSLGKETHKDKEKYRRLKKYKDGKKSKKFRAT